jgi:nucleotide-binding universal stress UspA family protein
MPECPRPEPGPILVPVDFSPHSEQALALAADLSRNSGTRLLVLHVVHDPAESPGTYVLPENGDTLMEHTVAAEKRLAAFLAEAAARHPQIGAPDALETRLVTGLPASRIVEIAELEGASQIVMGSLGRTGLAHVLLGSKAESVVRHSALPVTIVKTPKAED